MIDTEDVDGLVFFSSNLSVYVVLDSILSWSVSLHNNHVHTQHIHSGSCSVLYSYPHGDKASFLGTHLRFFLVGSIFVVLYLDSCTP